MSELSQYSKHAFVEASDNNSWANLYRSVPDGSRVLDVGCSTGNFGAALEQLKNCTVVGIDISEADIAEASTKISLALVMDVTATTELDKLGTFDVIVFADVLEHLIDPRATLRVARQLLNDGGQVLYSIPHMGHQSVRMDVMGGRFPYTELGLLDRTHLHFYDRNEVYDIFASSGFDIVAERPTVVGYPVEWLTERLASMGLTPSPTFFDMLRATESNVYQFIGTAVPKYVHEVTPDEERVELSPPDEILARAESVLAENERLRTELAAAIAHLDRMRSNPFGTIGQAVRRRVLRR